MAGRFVDAVRRLPDPTFVAALGKTFGGACGRERGGQREAGAC